MSEKFGISFIIAAYNLGDSLVRCVRSIQRQSLDQIEILIVNDKSTDDTLDIATDLCLSDPKNRTRCISHIHNLGLPSVRNTGLMAAQMKYIWHVDGDDFLPEKDVASQLLHSLEELGLLAVKFPVFELTDGNPFSSDLYADRLSRHYSCESVPCQLVDKEYGFGGAFSIVYSKSFALSLQVFNLEGVNIGEDQILISQLLKSLPCIGLVNIPMYVYDKTGQSMMRKSWSLAKYLEERLYIHFLINQFRNLSWRLNSVAKQRCEYLYKKLFKRAESDLSNCEFNLIKACWSSDLNLLRKFSDFESYLNPKIQAFLDQSLMWNQPKDFSSLFELIFSDTEFVIHCGAHKTATTYLQACLNDNRYDLALHGVIYIDYYQFRKKILVGLQDNSHDLRSIQSNLVELCLPLLFRKPKKVIIFDENLVAAGTEFWSKKPSLGQTFACFEEGYNFRLLRKLIPAFEGHKISLVYCIRDIKDYITSRYCEQIKWHHFLEFDEYIQSLALNINNISWEFVCKQLHDLCNSFNLYDPLIVSFEEIKKDFSGFLNFLVHVGPDSAFSYFKDTDIVFPESFLRSSPSTEAINLAFKNIAKKGPKTAQKLYKKLVIDGFGETKYSPLKQDKYSDICLYLDNVYKSNVTSLLTFKSNLLSDGSDPALISTLPSFKSLSDPVSPHEKSLSRLIDNPSDDLNRPYGNSLWNSFNCFDAYTNAEGYESFNFTRLHFGFNRKKGVCAMLRVKNEEDNIQAVLLSCLKVFDEIVVVDNNSNDATLAIVSIVRATHPSFAEKIKVYSYPFDVARCGQENYDCPENSVHSLAYYYNYCLSLCSFSHIFKWDGDMILPAYMVDHFLSFKNSVLEGSRLSDSTSTMFGVPVGITVFKGHNGRYYSKKDEFEAEPRLFENRSDVRFVKDILWERLFAPFAVCSVRSEQPVFVELKDVGQDEFSHWKVGGLGMGPRKRREFENFKQISQLTVNDQNPTVEVLQRFGFTEYTKPLV